ncbi:MAG: hypothetical protein A2498_15315 [Lentisphaerae bacterium RIFOXYC12_FULL_60_16]|nr:MAG: hypothetical protein A2498_15315 [Lentisphaerae bacterium RIFOXYC12_FULL_60_16]OGV78546.1 MAG: hypothetical protein A2340_12080 [Lentisphaerae bacterium RIFOXYB12_FULL_60_10]
MHLFMDSRHLTWDTTVLEDSTLRDVDAKAVRKFLEIANAERRWNVNPKTSAQKVLSQLGLCKGTHLKVAGLLLFGRNPQQSLTQAMVRCARFKGTAETHFIDMKVIQGNIVDQLEQAMTFIERNIRMGAEIKGLRREDQWEYPLDALREALVNAICHRDYASTANVQVRIFDDRLEIWNPGELPAGMTVDDLRREHESKPRNRLIANAFFLIKYVEQFGTGTRRIIDDCRSKGLPEPEFKVRPGTFIATFRPAKDSKSVSDASSKQAKAQEAQVKAQEAQVKLTAIERDILNACLQAPRSGQELLNAAGYSTRTGNFKRVVKKMLQYGLLVMSIPDKPNSRLQKYSLTAEGKASILSGRYSGPGISARLVRD